MDEQKQSNSSGKAGKHQVGTRSQWQKRLAKEH